MLNLIREFIFHYVVNLELVIGKYFLSVNTVFNYLCLFIVEISNNEQNEIKRKELLYRCLGETIIFIALARWIE